jgi:hypothetical protein
LHPLKIQAFPRRTRNLNLEIFITDEGRQTGFLARFRQFSSRDWKGFDWDDLDRLHRAGMISEPLGTAKSVVFTEVGLERSERLLRELFGDRA